MKVTLREDKVMFDVEFSVSLMLHHQKSCMPSYARGCKNDAFVDAEISDLVKKIKAHHVIYKDAKLNLAMNEMIESMWHSRCGIRI